MFHANRFAAKLIDELLTLQDKGYISIRVIACEVPFLDSKRKADILVITDDDTIAIEIKSEADSLGSLEKQFRDYKSTFSQVYLATNARHTQRVKKILPLSPGIIEESEDNLKIIRYPKKTRNYLKKNLVSLFTKEELSRSISLSSTEKKRLDLQAIREICIKNFSRDELFKLSRDNLRKRYEKNYKAFLNERGSRTHTDDLLQLSRRYKHSISSKINGQF